MTDYDNAKDHGRNGHGVVPADKNKRMKVEQTILQRCGELEAAALALNDVCHISGCPTAREIYAKVSEIRGLIR